jgi:hypothetical protein
MIALGLALQARGHRATILTNDYFEELIENAGWVSSLWERPSKLEPRSRIVRGRYRFPTATPWKARPHGRFEKLTLIGPYGVTVRITPLNNNKPCSILFS